MSTFHHDTELCTWWKKYNIKKMGRWINGQLCSMRCLKHSACHTREINLQNMESGGVEPRLPDGGLLITMLLPFRIPHKPKTNSRETADSNRQQHLCNFALYSTSWLVFGHSLIKQEMRWWVPGYLKVLTALAIEDLPPTSTCESWYL